MTSGEKKKMKRTRKKLERAKATAAFHGQGDRAVQVTNFRAIK